MVSIVDLLGDQAREHRHGSNLAQAVSLRLQIAEDEKEIQVKEKQLENVVNSLSDEEADKYQEAVKLVLQYVAAKEGICNALSKDYLRLLKGNRR